MHKNDTNLGALTPQQKHQFADSEIVGINNSNNYSNDNNMIIDGNNSNNDNSINNNSTNCNL